MKGGRKTARQSFPYLLHQPPAWRECSRQSLAAAGRFRPERIVEPTGQWNQRTSICLRLISSIITAPPRIYDQSITKITFIRLTFNRLLSQARAARDIHYRIINRNRLHSQTFGAAEIDQRPRARSAPWPPTGYFSQVFIFR